MTQPPPPQDPSPFGRPDPGQPPWQPPPRQPGMSDPQWTAPPPPMGDDTSIMGRRVAGGIGLAFLAHLLGIGVAIGLLPLLMRLREVSSTEIDNRLGIWLGIAALMQVLVFVGCLVFGIRGIRRGDRGRGLGLIIGWAVGIIVLPVIGFGVCVVVVSGLGVG